MASADYLCCSKCRCKIVYAPEDEHPKPVYCPDCLEAEFAKCDGYFKRIKALKSLLGRARPHVHAPLGTLAADIDLELNR